MGQHPRGRRASAPRSTARWRRRWRPSAPTKKRNYRASNPPAFGTRMALGPCPPCHRWRARVLGCRGALRAHLCCCVCLPCRSTRPPPFSPGVHRPALLLACTRDGELHPIPPCARRLLALHSNPSSGCGPRRQQGPASPKPTGRPRCAPPPNPVRRARAPNPRPRLRLTSAWRVPPPCPLDRTCLLRYPPWRLCRLQDKGVDDAGAAKIAVALKGNTTATWLEYARLPCPFTPVCPLPPPLLFGFGLRPNGSPGQTLPS